MLRSLVSSAPPAVRDVTLLLARVGLAVVLVAHGWQKWSTNTLAGTADGFSAMGVPLPGVSAAVAASVELAGGLLLLLGLLTPVAGVLVAAVMAGAWWYAHRGAGVLVSDGGGELVAAIGLLALVLAAVGPGRLSLDALLGRGRAVSPAGAPAARPAADARPRS